MSSDADRARLAAEALAQAKADAAARGSRPAPADGPDAERSPPPASARRSRSGRRPRRDDPQPLTVAIEALISEQGWEQGAAAGSVFGRWAAIVGPELAAHARPVRMDGGELVVQADSTAWATQLRLLAGQLMHRLNAALGPGTVQRLQIRGPAGPARRPGQWRVRGGRGPRDTYG